AQLERERNAASYQSHVSSSGGSTAHAVAVPPGVSSVLACIRQYESGDNYSDTSNPYYRGAYQFSWSTWQSVGGSGDPASASASEQDMRAQLLVSRSGWGAWSTASLCGV
ncbi:MAG TPA: transglycosylase family protein, partial [Acidimicrobiales bacterium]|nr:transglycosylase family protein [Acidimicrobiales bacterium]